MTTTFEFFWKIDRVKTSTLIQKSSTSELSSRFFGRLKIFRYFIFRRWCLRSGDFSCRFFSLFVFCKKQIGSVGTQCHMCVSFWDFGWGALLSPKRSYLAFDRGGQTGPPRSNDFFFGVADDTSAADDTGQHSFLEVFGTLFMRYTL